MPRIIVKGTSPNEDKILAIYKFVDENTVDVYFGEIGYKQISREEFKKMRSLPRSSKYMLIMKNEKDPILKTIKDLRKEYQIIYKEAILLKNITNGQINLFRTGSVSKTGLQLFYDLCNPPTPDKIEQYESEIIEKCYNGALIHGKTGYKGYCYKYDIVSQYPNIMRSKKLKFPIGKGKLQTMTNEEFNALPY